MGLFSNTNNLFHNDDKFDIEEYDKYNEAKIKEFKDRYDLTNVTSIRSIPIFEAKRYPDGGISVVYMPEQILNRQATEYKKEKKYDLAIACLLKANELYPYSFYAYQRENYERVVDIMILAGKFEEAKKEHERLDKKYGTRLQELKHLQDVSEGNGWEERESYQKRVVDPYISESNDKEQYYWLLEHFSKLAPKSFGIYRKMKKMNSDNYKKIIEEIEKLGYKIEEIKFWY